MKVDLVTVTSVLKVISGMLQSKLNTVNDYTTYENKQNLLGNEFDNLFLVEIEDTVINVIFNVRLYNKYGFYLCDTIDINNSPTQKTIIRDVYLLLENIKLTKDYTISLSFTDI